jgi:hypothetical protein
MRSAPTGPICSNLSSHAGNVVFGGAQFYEVTIMEDDDCGGGQWTISSKAMQGWFFCFCICFQDS